MLTLTQHYDEVVERQEQAMERAAAQAAALAVAEEKAARERLERQQVPVTPPPEPAPQRGEAPSPQAMAPDPYAALGDVPEDKLVRPIRWRRRGPDDWLDDEDGHDPYRALTEYDPLAADGSWDD